MRLARHVKAQMAPQDLSVGFQPAVTASRSSQNQRPPRLSRTLVLA
jgi:hypothetical protein